MKPKTLQKKKGAFICNIFRNVCFFFKICIKLGLVKTARSCHGAVDLAEQKHPEDKPFSKKENLPTYFCCLGFVFCFKFMSLFLQLRFEQH